MDLPLFDREPNFDKLITSSQPTPEPLPARMLEKILEQVKAHAEERKAADPRNLVFEFSEHVPENQAFVMPRRNFEDGRHRVFMHPSRQQAIESAIAALPDGPYEPYNRQNLNPPQTPTS